jgi:hypothetical protein
VSGVTVPLMSDGELSRLELLRHLDQKRLTTEAARLLGVMWSCANEIRILRCGPRCSGGEFAARSVGVLRGAALQVPYQLPVP